MPKGFLGHKGIVTMMEEYISYSKLIFLDAENNSKILNEEKGVWDDGNWYSNTTYKDYGFYDFGGKKVYKNDSVFDSGSFSNNKYGSAWTPKTSPTYLGGSYKNGVTRSYSDNDDWDMDYSIKPTREAEVFEEDDSCECCRNYSDRLKFSQTYRVYCCNGCWNEFVADSEGVWDGYFDSSGLVV
jgi:hypothetical protein